jgi:hypothetical protein
MSTKNISENSRNIAAQPLRIIENEMDMDSEFNDDAMPDEDIEAGEELDRLQDLLGQQKDLILLLAQNIFELRAYMHMPDRRDAVILRLYRIVCDQLPNDE